MGYNISPLLFFIEICNNDKETRRSTSGFSLRGTQQPYLDGCGEPDGQCWERGSREVFWTCRSCLWMEIKKKKTDLRHTDTRTLISNLSIFQSVSKLFSLVELDL